MLGRVALSMVLGRTDVVDVRLPMTELMIWTFFGDQLFLFALGSRLQMLCLGHHDNCFVSF